MQMDKEKHALFIMLYYVVIMTDYYIFFQTIVNVTIVYFSLVYRNIKREITPVLYRIRTE